MTVIAETIALGKRYRRVWALQDCTLSVPAGRVIGLVGPNGAGKTTLLHLLTGLARPTTGTVSVFGRSAHDPEVRARVGFVAQGKPLYHSFTVADTVALGHHLNPGWDQRMIEERLRVLGIPARRRIGQLSGGQRAQVALALALGKHPDLLLLDEPVANLDPLARKEFMQTLMAEVEASGVSVILSSHVVAELDQVCDHLILLNSSHVQLAGDIETMLESHKILTGPRVNGRGMGPHTVISASHTARQTTLLVELDGPVLDPTWQVNPVGLEQLILAYMSRDAASGLELASSDGGAR